MNKITALLSLLRRGNAVADPALWKNRGEALNAAIVALAFSVNDVAAAFGVQLQINEGAAMGIALVAVWLVGLFNTVATSDKVGLLPERKAPAAPADHDAGGA